MFLGWQGQGQLGYVGDSTLIDPRHKWQRPPPYRPLSQSTLPSCCSLLPPTTQRPHPLPPPPVSLNPTAPLPSRMLRSCAPQPNSSPSFPHAALPAPHNETAPAPSPLLLPPPRLKSTQLPRLLPPAVLVPRGPTSKTSPPRKTTMSPVLTSQGPRPAQWCRPSWPSGRRPWASQQTRRRGPGCAFAGKV